MNKDNICALATSSGIGAIAIIRVSGPDAISICDTLFKSVKAGKSLLEQKSHTIHLGTIENEGQLIDEVLVSLFKGPNSYTGENVIEISCHGSTFIQQQILQTLIKKGCRTAEPGEFTFRAYMNGKMDLSQAEAVSSIVKRGRPEAVAEYIFGTSVKGSKQNTVITDLMTMLNKSGSDEVLKIQKGLASYITKEILEAPDVKLLQKAKNFS